jgi:DNA-binding NarL/FixJ family response regulator/two-component sensor histidine kinase
VPNNNVAVKLARAPEWSIRWSQELPSRCVIPNVSNATAQVLVSVQEEERRRIAREMHDELGQGLALLSLQIAQIRKQATAVPFEVDTLLDGLREQVADVADDMHRICYHLYPPVLESLGLIGGLQALCREHARSTGVTPRFTHDEIPSEIPKETALCGYRVVQEALTNIAKHSTDASVQVELRHMGGGIHLVITDQGCGFDMDGRRVKHGLGLIAVRERVLLIGGDHSIHSLPGRGTQVTAFIPLEKNATPVGILRDTVRLAWQLDSPEEPDANERKTGESKALYRPTVVIADDHQLVAHGLAKLVDEEFMVVEVVDNGRALSKVVRQKEPDLVLVDIGMPDVSGLEVTRTLSKESPKTKVLVVSMHTQPELIQEALKAGASGYVLKRSAPIELVEAMWTVLKGESYLSPALARDALFTFLQPGKRSLTARQRDILRLVAAGMSGNEIARELTISVKTVQFHKAAIMKRLGIHSVAELTKYAIDHGIF